VKEDFDETYSHAALPRAPTARRCVGRVIVTLWGVEKLIAQGSLGADQREDPVAIRWAAQAFLGDALKYGVKPGES
jgi:hypothetical protein